MPAKVAFLFDVDNTLLDNDMAERRYAGWIDEHVGEGASVRFRRAYEAVRAERDYADYLGAVQRAWNDDGRDPRWLVLGDFLLDFPSTDCVFDGAFDALRSAAEYGPTWIVSDGDVVMQPRKIRRAGLWDAVHGQVLIFVHKENALQEIERRCPAQRYVMVDDKIRVLDAVKRQWGDRVCTVFVRQGHYAFDPRQIHAHPAADRTIEAIDRFAALAELLAGAAR
ncbi:MAG: HAD family hydrolase [Burkholderiaceae bacterium]|jgi:FMN phosphatase YigB (HAD superfamily)|nr:HAD family hydrolase [Burkholderiaceae bacterium]